MTAPDDTLLVGRRAVVIGNDEIGIGIAERLKRAGARVSLQGRPDLASPADALIPATANEAGTIDILVVNVLPQAVAAPIEAMSAEAIGLALGSVALAARVLQAGFARMRERGGRIILVGHRYGETVNEGLAAYNAAAWALIGLVRTAAVEWGQHQISTNLLLPLAATRELEAARTQRPRVLELMLSQLPLRRAGDPVEDIGGAVLFLASDAAAFINGEVVHADGGQHVAGPVLNPVRYAPWTGSGQ